MKFGQKINSSSPIRKGKSLVQRLPRFVGRLLADELDYQERPPVIVNSLPKSGTHLLMQLANAFPGAVNYGTFLAQTPSLTLKERTQSQINARIGTIAPGEVVGAHLYYNQETASAIQRKSAIQFFIWRDPRDVLLSEAHYLAEMASFHFMHRKFRKIHGPDARVRLAITGDGGLRYPDALKRIMPYMGWRNDPNTLTFRYENLVNPTTQGAELRRAVDHYLTHSKQRADPNVLSNKLSSAIDPKKSHTFYKGGVGRWKSEMSARNQRLIQQMFEGSDLLDEELY